MVKTETAVYLYSLKIGINLNCIIHAIFLWKENNANTGNNRGQNSKTYYLLLMTF